MSKLFFRLCVRCQDRFVGAPWEDHCRDCRDAPYDFAKANDEETSRLSELEAEGARRAAIILVAMAVFGFAAAALIVLKMIFSWLCAVPVADAWPWWRCLR